jgi:hypothetical protein
MSDSVALCMDGAARLWRGTNSEAMRGACMARLVRWLQRGFLNGTFGPACCGHPSIEVDTAMAKSGAAFIKQTLGW